MVHWTRTTMITKLTKDVIGCIIHHLEICDVQCFALGCKHLARAIRANATWAECIRRSGQFHKIYNGTNTFCVREFLKKDRSWFIKHTKQFKLCTTKPLDVQFVDRYLQYTLIIGINFHATHGIRVHLVIGNKTTI